MAELIYRNTDGRTYTYSDQNELYRALEKEGRSDFSWFCFSGGLNRVAMLPGEGPGLNIESGGSKFHLVSFTSRSGIEVNEADEGESIDAGSSFHYDPASEAILFENKQIVRTTVPKANAMIFSTFTQILSTAYYKTGNFEIHPVLSINTESIVLGSSFTSSGSVTLILENRLCSRYASSLETNHRASATIDTSRITGRGYVHKYTDKTTNISNTYTRTIRFTGSFSMAEVGIDYNDFRFGTLSSTSFTNCSSVFGRYYDDLETSEQHGFSTRGNTAQASYKSFGSLNSQSTASGVQSFTNGAIIRSATRSDKFPDDVRVNTFIETSSGVSSTHTYNESYGYAPHYIYGMPIPDQWQSLLITDETARKEGGSYTYSRLSTNSFTSASISCSSKSISARQAISFRHSPAEKYMATILWSSADGTFRISDSSCYSSYSESSSICSFSTNYLYTSSDVSGGDYYSGSRTGTSSSCYSCSTFSDLHYILPNIAGSLFHETGTFYSTSFHTFAGKSSTPSGLASTAQIEKKYLIKQITTWLP